MSTRYPGGFINRSAPVVVGPVNGEGGSAPGVWTLEQAGYYRSKNLWPVPFPVGALWVWGRNVRGQLGQNNVINRSSPVQVGTSTDWSKLASGENHNAAVKSNGTLWLTGNNLYGQLGQNDTIYRSSPVQVGNLNSWYSVACGSDHTMATKNDGTLWAWGKGSTSGALGLNSATQFYSPVQVGALTTWEFISCGHAFTSAIKSDKTLWNWGTGGYGQLGQNNIVYYSSPVQVGSLSNWATVSGGRFHTAAVKTDGSLWTCGWNAYGQLGQNIAYSIGRSSPVQVGTDTTWNNVACGSNHVLATKTNGTLWAWGANANGQLGQNERITKSSPVQVGALTTWLKISALAYASIGVKTDGTLWVWGWNNFGQLSQNDVYARSSPVQVGALATWGAVTRGSASYSMQAILK